MSEDILKLALHFLCVKVDPNFIAYLLTTVNAINISLDTCRTYEEAEERIKKNQYDVYIVDFIPHENKTQRLLTTISQQNSQKKVVALTAEAMVEQKALAELKNAVKVDFILQKPIFPQQIDKFITDLLQIYSSPSVAPALDEMQALKEEYNQTIFSKIEVLQDLIHTVKKNPTKENFGELKSAIHKLAGSAGTYGYLPVSTLCKEEVLNLTKWISSEKALSDQDRQHLDQFLDHIKRGFQITAPESQASVSTGLNTRPMLYVLDRDSNFLELLKRTKEQFALDLKTESSPEKAFETIHSSFRADAIVISQTFAKAYSKDLVKEVQNWPKKPVLGLLLENDSIEVRLEAMQKGINYIFRKPVSPYTMLKAMKNALQVANLNHIKVLILDDDIDLCKFVVAVLTEIGINAKSIQSSSLLFPTLEEFQPSILLLDVVLPDYDGMNLLKTLRQDVAYQDLIVVIITSNEESTTRMNAYSANADDILFKPLDRHMLQKRMINLAERRNGVNEETDTLDYTGLQNRKELMTELHAILSQVKPNSFLALFEIHQYANWTLKEGALAGKDLLISLSNNLQALASSTIKCFNFNDSIFAILFDEGSFNDVEIKIYQFLSEFLEKNKQFNVHFNLTVLPISSPFKNAQELLHKGEEGLRLASDKSPHRSINVYTFENSQEEKSKEIVIVDSDQELLKILTQAFENHGIKVKSFSEGGDALQALSHCEKRQLPMLIIAERKLPDMDGIDLYSKLKAYFQKDIPFYVLTLFSSDKDVSDGLKKGILEYIVKPFNISILIHKVLKQLSKTSSY